MKTKGFILIVCVITCILLVNLFFSSGFIFAGGSFDYSNALKYSILFYDANKCGPDVSKQNVFDWRKSCHVNDGSDIGIDLSGGFHDAGDHVKFGLPQAYSASVLGWSFYEFKKSFKGGNDVKVLSTIKHFTDYFLKCHPKSDIFYYQIGDGDADHKYWGAPEEQPGNRPVLYHADYDHPASDVLGMTSSALSLMYLNYKEIDSVYAEKCLKAAKELYNMGRTNIGYSNGQSYYNSNSLYDDLSWAAIWLYQIEKDQRYIDAINDYTLKPTKIESNVFVHKWAMNWDDMYLPVFVKMVEFTGIQKYKDAINYNLDYWLYQIKPTPGGLKYLHNWGVLRYAASESMIAQIYYKQSHDKRLLDFAKSQINYILGDNPLKMSYVVGLGDKWPAKPHHRAANGYTYANSENQNPAKYLLNGALVGGPDMNDNYIDDINQYQYTEVALDYNAGLIGALAGYISLAGIELPDSVDAVTPTITPTVTSTITPTVTATEEPVPTDGDQCPALDKSKLSLEMFNRNLAGKSNTISPQIKITNIGNVSVKLEDLKIRYYYTADGKFEQNFMCDYAQLTGCSGLVKLKESVTGQFVKLTSQKLSADCFVEIGFKPLGQLLQPQANIELQMRFTRQDWSDYCQNGDYSFNASSKAYVRWDKVLAYVNGCKKWGTEP